jgi:hypothetical protein
MHTTHLLHPLRSHTLSQCLITVLTILIRMVVAMAAVVVMADGKVLNQWEGAVMLSQFILFAPQHQLLLMIMVRMVSLTWVAVAALEAAVIKALMKYAKYQ